MQNYVAEYPYPVKFVYVAFISRHSEEGLFSVAKCEEEIYYSQNGPNGFMGPCVKVHRESYEEAVRILEQGEL